jgi:hypothetical protein
LSHLKGVVILFAIYADDWSNTRTGEILLDPNARSGMSNPPHTHGAGTRTTADNKAVFYLLNFEKGIISNDRLFLLLKLPSYIKDKWPFVFYTNIVLMLKLFKTERAEPKPPHPMKNLKHYKK